MEVVNKVKQICQASVLSYFVIVFNYFILVICLPFLFQGYVFSYYCKYFTNKKIQIKHIIPYILYSFKEQ